MNDKEAGWKDLWIGALIVAAVCGLATWGVYKLKIPHVEINYGQAE
jgi:hypothetical protein